MSLKFIQRSEIQFNKAVQPKSGGTATVHQGTFENHVVAIKVPIQPCALTEKQFTEFTRELNVMASVKHPNCVLLLAACGDRNDPMLVMEWISGGTLFEALGKTDALSWQVRLRIAREIASAIEYLHLCNISHGDLKSMNVLLTSDFIAKICDFGAAIQRLNTTMTHRNSKSDASAPTLQYTLHYSAPELLQGIAADTKSDIYAFGIIMWEILNCKIPFEGVNPVHLPHLLQQGLKPEVSSDCRRTSGFPPAFVDLMEQCWEKDPALRPTAETVHRVLISIDPTARPSVPLLLYPLGHPLPCGSVFDCLRIAMQASPAIEFMLEQMMADVENMFKTDVNIRSVCDNYSILPAEAHAIMVFFLTLSLFINCNYPL